MVDRAGGQSTSPVGRYGVALAQALAATAPRGVEVAPFASAADAEQRERVAALLPGLEVAFAKVPPRELREAWLHSFTTARFDGILHATSLLAPLRSREGTPVQSVVTVHRLPAATAPAGRRERWERRALRRAVRLADGIVVPTHAHAAALEELHDVGDRVRVVAGGPPRWATPPADAEARRAHLGLPGEYLVAWTSPGALADAQRLVDVVASGAMPNVPVVVLGPVAFGDTTIAELAVAAGLRPARLRMLGDVADADAAAVVQGATSAIQLDPDPGFAAEVLGALALGTPVVHPASEALQEIAAEATLAVQLAGDASDADRLAHGLAQVLEHEPMRERLALLGQDRARAFDWSTTATQLWHLHAEL
ncbi:glycosyltransferase [Agrococcus sp. SGAir0287]|uniref:glycosyltransferase n=1 Tax=Agrococcus sp. SGAir0287 TaxID=2070347 RepID=UPI001586D8B6|nr:glycosyltransferase [Agrococcus sp. SGAir0287]